MYDEVLINIHFSTYFHETKDKTCDCQKQKIYPEKVVKSLIAADHI